MAEPVRTQTRSEDWLVGGGNMGQLVRTTDWSKTPLGAIESWPQSLRTTVSLCLASNFPISLAWGPKHVQIYNDGYWPICGGKHPDSMGQDFSECWASAWPAIGEAFERALSGETSYIENQRMFLDRHGYLEETFFTFSFSPIRDETGCVGGLFHPVTEMTAKIVGERRTRALRDLAARAGRAHTTQEAFTLAAQALSENDLDLPFVLFYNLNPGGTRAELIAATQSIAGAIGAPTVIIDSARSGAWPLSEVVRTNNILQIDDLRIRFGGFGCGPYPETPTTALLLPITPTGAQRPSAILVAGVSARLPLDDVYRAYYELLASTVTSVIASARAHEEERVRAEALAELDRAKTAFFSNVSHEFRTPLTLMLGPLEEELVEHTHPLPPDRRDRLETVHRNALRLLKLVNTLLDFSRVEAGRIQASFEAVDLATYTAELASGFRSAIEKAGLSLAVDCPALPEAVYVDREMWEKIVLNLLSNAFKYTFHGGIGVTLRWCGDSVDFAVTDSGVGIPAAELPRLFDRFHRVKGARSRTHEGTGIGLALVRELVHAHGGTVRVESREDQGSGFTVTLKTGCAHLPRERIGASRFQAATVTHAAEYVDEARHWLANDPAVATSVHADGDGSARRNPAEIVSAPPGSRPHILWADDNADMREYVRRLLSANYDVTAVSDGITAVETAQTIRPDLVLTDIMMPGLDGFGVLRQLRADERTRAVPVILLSARAGEESSVEGLEAGADDYLIKPFSSRELMARVGTHLDLARMRRKIERQRIAAIEADNVRIVEAGRLKTAFLANMSHELRTPLNSILGFAQLMQDGKVGPVTPDHREYLGDIVSSARHLLQLINDILDLAKIEAGKMEFWPEAVDVGEIVSEIRALLRSLAAEKRITLVANVDRAIGEVNLDPVKLKQVLFNYVSNAIKFTPDGGHVTIDVRDVSAGQFGIDVTDTGIGVSQADQRRLFVEFQQLDSGASTRAGGTGLGLALTKRIVEAQGGRVQVRSSLGTGSTFSAILPRHIVQV